MGSTKGKVVLIVGGGRGLGRATAGRLCQEGAKLILVARTSKELAESAEEMRMLGAELLTITADVTQEADVARVAAAIRDAFGAVDVIVNCAGEALISELPETSVADLERSLAANLGSVFLVMREFLPVMMDRGTGQIINVTSRTGVYTPAIASVYGAAKAGAAAFSRAWAAEARKQGVNIVTIAPGPMDTPMRWAATPGFARERTMSADTVADFLAWIIAHPDIAFEEIVLPISLHY